MKKPKRISELCKECPTFDKKIKELVLSGPFDAFDSSQGRAYQSRMGKWVEYEESEDASNNHSN